MGNKRNKLILTIITTIGLIICALSAFLFVRFLSSSVNNGSPILTGSSNNSNNSSTGDSAAPIQDSFYDDYAKPEEYDGPTISQVDQYIFNSDGKILKDFHDGERYYLYMNVNADASEAILVYDDVCYYIDAELNVTEIATDIDSAGICYDGRYCYYITNMKDDKKGIYLYDTKNQNTKLIYEANIINACLSPNGKVLAFFEYYATPKIHIYENGIEKDVFVADDRSSVEAISNDANTLFVTEYGNDDSAFICIDNEKTIRLSNELLLECYYDRDCKQAMFMDDDGLKYFNSGDKDATIVTTDTEDLRFEIAAGKRMIISYFDDKYILDTDCFSDALMLYTFDECYTLSGSVPEIICLTNNNPDARSFSMAITKEGPTCIGSSGGDLVKFSYDGNNVTETILFTSDELSLDYVASKTLDKIWFIYDNDVYYISEGKEPVMVADQGSKTNFTLLWDPFSDMCFYVKDNKYLCRVGTDSSEDVRICDYCNSLTNIPGKDNLVGFYDHNKTKYIVIGDEIIKE